MYGLRAQRSIICMIGLYGHYSDRDIGPTTRFPAASQGLAA
jgi:hypothetical protein